MKWILELKDLFSDDAEKAAKAAERLEKALEKVAAEANDVDRAMGKAGKGGKGFFDSKVGKGIKGAGAGLAAGVAGAVAAGTAIIAGAGVVAFEQLGQVAQGAMGKQAIMAGMSQILGGADKAEAAFGRIAAKADAMGMGVLDAAKQAQGLLAMGFKLDGQNNVFKVLEAGQALKNINPTANVDNVITALSQIQAKGKLTAEELHGQLGDAGVNIGFVYDELAKKMGKSTDEVRKLMAAGKITSDMGISAVFASIERQGGASLEKLAAMGKGSLANMLARLQNLPQEIGARADLSGVFASMSGSLDQIIGLMTSPAVVGAVEGIFATGGKMLERMIPSIEKVVGVFTDPRAGTFFDGIANVLGSGIEGFADGFAAAADAMLGIDAGNMDNIARAANAFGQAIGAVTATLLFFANVSEQIWTGLNAIGDATIWVTDGIVAMGAAVASGIGTAIEWFFGLQTAAYEAIGAVVDQALSLGSNIISGIVDGIMAGASAVVDAIVGVATDAIAAAESVLGIASPSKVFERMFLQVGAGAERGADRSAAGVAEATGNMAAGATASGAAAARAVTYSRSANDNSRTMNATVNVMAAKDPVATGNAVRSSLRTMQLQGG